MKIETISKKYRGVRTMKGIFVNNCPVCHKPYRPFNYVTDYNNMFCKCNKKIKDNKIINIPYKLYTV